MLKMRVLKSFCIFTSLLIIPVFGSVEKDGMKYIFSGTLKPENFYGKNISLLNNSNCDLDKVWYARHTLDLSMRALHRVFVCDEQQKAVEFFATIRNRSIWGNPGSVASTNEAPIKLGSAVVAPHKHTFSRHIFWMREMWLALDLGTAFGLSFENKHTFTIGAFPFSLGSGIALGSAFAVGPAPLGFYTDSNIEQFAFGAKLSGDIISDALGYDLYASILDSKSGTLSEVGEKLRGQEYGRIENPARGFGKVNFIIAGRLNWYLFKNKNGGTFKLEPYVLFNHEPEQKIEFRGDASSRLGTIGLASEYKSDWAELSFDCAFNMGKQRVRGWDRNQIEVETRASDGALTLVNSQVVDSITRGPTGLVTAAGTKVPVRSNLCTATIDGAAVTKKNDSQDLIAMAHQDEASNARRIGTSSCGDSLFNAQGRYRNSYTNQYRGWMAMIDGCVKALCGDLRLCGAFGFASGDDNPNDQTIDGVYDGFIGLQEIYSGKRVKSAFLMSGAGKIKRPLTQRDPDRERSRFAQVISGFTNLIYVGTGLQWSPSCLDNRFFVHPNALLYWQAKAGKKFDAFSGKDLTGDASKYLGFETNIFVNYKLLENMTLFCVASAFFPGTFYSDIRGKPLSSDDQKALDRLDRTGFSDDHIPNIGRDIAYTADVGLEFKF